MQKLALQRQVSQFRRIFQDPVLAVALIGVALFVFVMILLPLFSVIGESLSSKNLPLFQRYLSEPIYQTIIGNTLVLGIVTAATSTAVGFLFAFVQVKLDVPFKRLMHVLALIPIISPPFAVATAIIVLFGRNGLITRGVFGIRFDIYGLFGLTLALSLSLFTVAYLTLRGMMQALDPALDEAATNLGAGKWRIFRTVTLPMLLPGIASAFLLVFVEAIADLGNPLVLGGNFEVLATRVYISIIGLYDTSSAAVFSMILLVPSLLVFILQNYIISRSNVISVTGKPSGRPQYIYNPFVRWTLFGLCMAICILIALIYGTIVIGAFVEVLGVNNNFTLRHFNFVLNGLGSQAMWDTTRLSIISTPVAGLLGMLIAFLVVRKEFFGRAALDFATMLGIAVPGTIIGIGFLLVFNTPTVWNLPFFGEVIILPKLTGGQAIFGGALAIVIVYVVRSVPTALRSGVAALTQIDPAIEEASTSLGADNARTFRRITLPLIRPALLASLIFAFARSMTTISAIVFLTTPQTKIMTQQILNEVENVRYGNAFAYCVILILIVLTAIGVLYLGVGSATGAEQTFQRGAR